MIQTDEMDRLCDEATKSLAAAYGGEAAYRTARMNAVMDSFPPAVRRKTNERLAALRQRTLDLGIGWQRERMAKLAKKAGAR
jgi:hypothetical protein